MTPQQLVVNEHAPRPHKSYRARGDLSWHIGIRFAIQNLSFGTSLLDHEIYRFLIAVGSLSMGRYGPSVSEWQSLQSKDCYRPMLPNQAGSNRLGSMLSVGPACPRRTIRSDDRAIPVSPKNPPNTPGRLQAKQGSCPCQYRRISTGAASSCTHKPLAPADRP